VACAARIGRPWACGWPSSAPRRQGGRGKPLGGQKKPIQHAAAAGGGAAGVPCEAARAASGPRGGAGEAKPPSRGGRLRALSGNVFLGGGEGRGEGALAPTTPWQPCAAAPGRACEMAPERWVESSALAAGRSPAARGGRRRRWRRGAHWGRAKQSPRVFVGQGRTHRGSELQPRTLSQNTPQRTTRVAGGAAAVAAGAQLGHTKHKRARGSHVHLLLAAAAAASKADASAARGWAGPPHGTAAAARRAAVGNPRAASSRRIKFPCARRAPHRASAAAPRRAAASARVAAPRHAAAGLPSTPAR
jgi:hypothetical protein